jgi:hypothetical protein
VAVVGAHTDRVAQKKASTSGLLNGGIDAARVALEITNQTDGFTRLKRASATRFGTIPGCHSWNPVRSVCTSTASA